MGNWTAENIASLNGRTFVVTGATSGLGLASAAEFAAHAGQVVVTGRNREKLARAMETVRSVATGPEPTEVLLDLASLDSIRDAAAQITELFPRIDVLLNNAGVMATPREATDDGFELQIGTNHLGHFALTGLLLKSIPHRGADSRVVTVASLAHRTGRLDPDDLSFERRRYQPWIAYGQSKLANLLFTAELDRRARGAGWSLKSVAAHPGWAATNLGSEGTSFTQHIVTQTGARLVQAVIGQSAENGALPSLYASTADDVVSGDYYGPSGFLESRGEPKRVGRASAARETEAARRLWEVSQELTGVDYGLAPAE
ncbi:MAG: oxidoreductase [Candidatus Nanopelagicales bacterium]|nr:oxidoreductase [Candidatus Nanopelagicales bacterium]